MQRQRCRMLWFIDTAETLFREVEGADRPQAVLHGDLHHWNMLRDLNGRWKAIDPKGVIGAAHLETGRFMINQIGMVGQADRMSYLDEMTSVIGERLGESRRTIAICGFIECVLATCWSFDHNEPSELAESIEKCQVFFDYARRQ